MVKNTDTLSIANAKLWYTQSTKLSQGQKSEVLIKSDKGASGIKQEILWESAQKHILSSGEEVIAVPINVTLFNEKKAKGNYFILITREGRNYRRVIVNDQKRSNSKDVIASLTAIEELYKNAITSNLTHSTKLSLKNTQIGIKNVQEQECYDYYWVEITYDEDGNILEYFEVYLYTECQDIGGSGGGSGPEGINWGQPTSELLDVQEVDQESEESAAVMRTAWYKWKFHSKGIYQLISYEKAQIKKEDSQSSWKFISFVHLNQWPEGDFSTGQDVEINMIDADVNMLPIVTTVNLLYILKMTRTSTSGTYPAYSPSFQAKKNFTPGSQGTTVY